MDTRAVVGALLLLVAGVATGAAPAAGQETGASNAATAAGAAVQADNCTFPVTETDATGTEVTVEEEPQRIVTLAPSAAQTLWAFNASDKVVGVSSNAAYLNGSEEKEVVAEGQDYDVETIVGLEPDLVLAPNVVGNDTVQSLRDSGLTVYRFESADNFTQLYEKVELTGALAGECAAGNETAADMRQRVTAIEEAVSDEERPGALYTFFGWTAGGETFIDAIITTAGTENVAAQAGITDFAELNDEVVANNSEEIEWLILNSNPASHPNSAVYNETAAVQNNQTVVVNEDYLNQPAPRTVWALENITQAIHPEAYEEAQASLANESADNESADNETVTETPAENETATATESGTATETESGATTETEEGATDTPASDETETAAETGTEAVDDTPEETAASGDGPGFTAVTAALAMLAAALLARRR